MHSNNHCWLIVNRMSGFNIAMLWQHAWDEHVYWFLTLRHTVYLATKSELIIQKKKIHTPDKDVWLIMSQPKCAFNSQKRQTSSPWIGYQWSSLCTRAVNVTLHKDCECNYTVKGNQTSWRPQSQHGIYVRLHIGPSEAEYVHLTITGYKRKGTEDYLIIMGLFSRVLYTSEWEILTIVIYKLPGRLGLSSCPPLAHATAPLYIQLLSRSRAIPVWDANTLQKFVRTCMEQNRVSVQTARLRSCNSNLNKIRYSLVTCTVVCSPRFSPQSKLVNEAKSAIKIENQISTRIAILLHAATAPLFSS